MFLVARGFSTIDTQYRYPEVLSKQLYNEPGKEEVEAAGPWINDVAVVVVRKSDADQVSRMLDSAQQHGLGMVKLVVEPWVGPADVDQDVGGATGEKRQPQEREQKPTPTADPSRIMYLNNHPLLNTRLIV